VPWISIVSSPVGRGAGTLAFTVAANNTAVQRTGTINVGGSIFQVSQAPGAGAPPPGPDPGPQSAGYEDLIRRARAALSQRNFNLAGQLAKEALAADAAKPDAYDVLGYLDLYLAGNVSAARANMQAAIARGGKATFQVLHDHSKLTFAQHCAGELHIWRNRVVFTSPQDRFEATLAELKEAKPNRSWLPVPSGPNNFRPQGHTFHIETRYRNYNLAGTSRLQKEEMSMILDFIDK
jgi:hypothetical protein